VTASVAKLPVASLVPVYDRGREVVIGFVIRRAAGAESFTPEGGFIGAFENINAAAIACWRHARHQPVEATRARP
jgi:hypothetical protein